MVVEWKYDGEYTEMIHVENRCDMDKGCHNLHELGYKPYNTLTIIYYKYIYICYVSHYNDCNN